MFLIIFFLESDTLLNISNVLLKSLIASSTKDGLYLVILLDKLLIILGRLKSKSSSCNLISKLGQT